MSGDQNKIPTWLIPVCFGFYLILNAVSWRFPFFWDTLLTSTLCNWFFTNGFNGGIPPMELDAGHPPLFYGYLIIWWSIMGKSLITSHLAMLPFLWIMIYQFIHISAKFLPNKAALLLASLLFCLETTILAQSTMVSYDIVILAMYLLGLRYLLKRKTIPVIIATTVLALISLRGVFAVGALFIVEWLFFRKQESNLQLVKKYLLAALLFIAWNIWHYAETGWMLFAVSDHWSDQRGIVGIKGIVKNLVVIVRNLMEPGRALLFILLALGILLHYKKFDNKFRMLLQLLVVPLVVFSVFFIPFSNPIGHRYLMIVFAMAILLLAYVLQFMKFTKAWGILLIVTLVLGHFQYQFYPTNISKGWDSSLAHLPYFKLKHELHDFLYEEKIRAKNICASFPLDVSLDQSDLIDDSYRPLQYNTSSVKDSIVQYIITSNLNNNIEDSDIRDIMSSFENFEQFERNGISITVWQRK